MKLKSLYEQLLMEINIPDEIYHVSPYVDEIESYGKLVPNGMGKGDDFGKGFGGGTSKGVSFTANLDAAEDYLNGIMLAIMLSKSKNIQSAVSIFKEWCKVQESRLGVDLSSLEDVFRSELERDISARPDSFYDVLKGARQIIAMKASRLDKRLDDPVIYGKIEKFSGVNLNNLGIVSVLKKDIPPDAVIDSGTDQGEIRISGAELPINKVVSRGLNL